MITKPVTEEQLRRWRELWLEHKTKITANRKTGRQLVEYLTALYSLEEIRDSEMLGVVTDNVLCSAHLAAKLPNGAKPEPRVFCVLNSGNGRLLYAEKDEVFAETERITVGIDMASGSYYAEGSSKLWDDLCAYQGVDEADLENYVCTGQYIECLNKRGNIIGYSVTAEIDRPLGSCHPNHSDMVYTVNYGFVRGIIAPDGEEQDVYVLGCDLPLQSCECRVIAVVHRLDDNEDKWVAAPEGISFTKEQIEQQISFQEKYFTSEIIMGEQLKEKLKLFIVSKNIIDIS